MLRLEKELAKDKRLPISGYNYSAVPDRLAEKGMAVSLTTIIDRAKRLDRYRARAESTMHDPSADGRHRRTRSTWRMYPSVASLRLGEADAHWLQR
jgi:hypothetical protein